jgi:predicted TPR repeat methyltransferase
VVTTASGAPHRVLCLVEPMTIRNGPAAFSLAVRQFARIAERLALVPRLRTAIVCHDALVEPVRGVQWYTPGTHGLPTTLSPDWRDRWREQLHGRLTPEWRAFHEHVLDDFRPSVVYVWNTNPAVEALYRARRLPLLHVELGGIRTSTGGRMSVDPVGFGASSALAAANGIPDTDTTAEWGWRWAAEHVLDEAQDLRPRSPANAADARPHIVVPLQYEDDVNWLLHPTFRDSVHFVDEVVPRLLAAGARRVTIRLHPWHRSTGVLARAQRWSGVDVDVARRSLLGTLRDVDGLVTLNSTVGLEALACGVPVVALSPCAYPVVQAPEGIDAVAAFVEDIASGSWWTDHRRRAVGSHLYRLVAHYSLPQDVYEDSTAHLDLLDGWRDAGADAAWFSERPARLQAIAEQHAGSVLRKRAWALRQQAQATGDRLADLHARTAQSLGDVDTARRLGLARWWGGAEIDDEDRLALARAVPPGEPAVTGAYLHTELLQAAPSAERTYHLASALERAGDLDAAAALFEDLVRPGGDDALRAGALYHLGTIARARGDLDTAARSFHECLTWAPGHRAALDALQATLRDGATDGWSAVDTCEWRELDPTSLSASLYGPAARGEKRYEVRFGNGRVLPIVQTRERSYADVRGATELSRYRLLTPFVRPGWRVLDCASGTGYGAAWLASQGARVTGADVDATAVTFARYRYDLPRFVRVSAPHLPFASEAFDAVTCVETLEHFGAHEAFIEDVARVLRPGGLLLLTTPPAGRHDSPFHVRERSWSETGTPRSSVTKSLRVGSRPASPCPAQTAHRTSGNVTLAPSRTGRC